MNDLLYNKTFMIGSLPHSSVDEALKILKIYPLTIPTWSQLPKRSFKEAMIPQYTEGFPGIHINEKEKSIMVKRDNKFINEITDFFENVVAENIDKFYMSKEYAEGFSAFIDELKRENKKLPAVKGQVTGPFTFGLGLNDEDCKAVWFDDEYREVVKNGLKMKALWQIKELKKYAEEVIISFDEPIFSALGTPAYLSITDEELVEVLNELFIAVHKAGAVAAIHCCGNMDWGLLASTDVDIICFDAFFYGEKLAIYPEAIKKFFDRGGILAWGIVPTSNSEEVKKIDLKTLKNKLESLIELFVNKGIPEEQVKKQIIFSPSCGIGTLTVDDSKKVLELLTKISI